MQKFDIWYMRPEFFREGIMGYNFLDQKNMLPDPVHLGISHVFLKQIEARDLEHAFITMQGEIWSPNGEARSLIKSKGLQHTSMSVGDIAVSTDSGAVWIVDNFGFKGIGITQRNPDLNDLCKSAATPLDLGVARFTNEVIELLSS